MSRINNEYYETTISKEHYFDELDDLPMSEEECNNLNDNFYNERIPPPAPKPPQRFMYDNPSIPILYEDNQIVCFTNGSGEIFVQHRSNKAEVRITPRENGLAITSDSRFTSNTVLCESGHLRN